MLTEELLSKSAESEAEIQKAYDVLVCRPSVTATTTLIGHLRIQARAVARVNRPDKTNDLLEEALLVVYLALTGKPENASLLVSSAAVLADLKHFPEAIVCAKEASELAVGTKAERSAWTMLKRLYAETNDVDALMVVQQKIEQLDAYVRPVKVSPHHKRTKSRAVVL